MAIELMPFITLILRVDVEQEISAAGWKYLMYYNDRARNSDGEIMVFGSMNGADVERDIGTLTSFGFVGPDNGEQSDMIVWESIFGPTTHMPDWLRVVDVDFFEEGRKTTRAWKLTKSGVYNLVNFLTEVKQPMKGYECDWAPHIGQIR